MDLRITFIGNATTLIRCGDITVLTDPNFLHQGQRAYLGYGLWSRRRRPPAITVDELPSLHAVVLSHMHGDHWDRVAERGLDRDIPIVTTHAAANRLHSKGFHAAHGLQTWRTSLIEQGNHRLTVTALPGRHAPMPLRRLLPPVMGSMLEFSDGTQQCRLYISGDTLLIDELAEIPLHFDAIDAGILHLGGTRLPAGAKLPFGVTVTMDGVAGAEAARRLNLPRVIPVHFDDYGVFASPLSDFTAAMHERGLGDRLIHVERGQTVTL